MVRHDSGAQVVYDTSHGFSRGSGSRSYANEWRNFMVCSSAINWTYDFARRIP